MPWAFSKAAEHQITQTDLPDAQPRTTFGTQLNQLSPSTPAVQPEHETRDNVRHDLKRSTMTPTASARKKPKMDNARNAKPRSADNGTPAVDQAKELQVLDRLEQTRQHLTEAQKALATTQERAERSRTIIAQTTARLEAERAINDSHAANLRRLRLTQPTSPMLGHANVPTSDEIRVASEIIVKQRRKVTSLTNDLRLAEVSLSTYHKNTENLQLRCSRLEARIVTLKSEYDNSQLRNTNPSIASIPGQQQTNTNENATIPNNSNRSPNHVIKIAGYTSSITPPEAEKTITNHTSETFIQNNGNAIPVVDSREHDSMTTIYKEQVQSLRRITSEQSLLIDKLYQEIEVLHAASKVRRTASFSPRASAVANEQSYTSAALTYLPRNTDTATDHAVLDAPDANTTNVRPLAGMTPKPPSIAAATTAKDPRHSLSFLGNASAGAAHSPPRPDRTKDLSISRLISQDHNVNVPTPEITKNNDPISPKTNTKKDSPEEARPKNTHAETESTTAPQPLQLPSRLPDSSIAPARTVHTSKRKDIKQSNRCTACIENKKYCNGEPICEACKLFYIGHELPEQYCSYPFIPKDKNSKSITPADYISDLNLEDSDAALATLQLKRKSRFWRTSTNADFPELKSVEPEVQTPVAKVVETGSHKRSDRLKGKIRRRYDSVSDDGTPASRRSRTSSEVNIRHTSPLITRRGTIISFKYRPEASEHDVPTTKRAKDDHQDKIGRSPASTTSEKSRPLIEQASRTNTKERLEQAQPVRAPVTADSVGSFRPVMPNFDA